MRTHAAIIVAASLSLSVNPTLAQETASAAITEPTVLIDGGHHSFLDAESRASLSRFLADSGFIVLEYDQPFRAGSFDDVGILIIIAPLSSRNALPQGWTQEIFDQTWRLPNPSAFSEEEIRSIVDWVDTGGSLLLITDHMPFAGAVQGLAQAFGIEVSNGFAVDAEALIDYASEIVANAGSIVFDRADGSLKAHPVTDGGSPDRRVERIGLFTGSAFQLPEGGISLLDLGPSFVSLLPEVSWQFSDDSPREPVGGWSQGGLLEFGRGRVAMFGELGILADPEAIAAAAEPNDPQEHNPRLLLNVLDWLSTPME